MMGPLTRPGQLVAAYPIGYFIDGNNGIPTCTCAAQTGWQVTWNSIAPDAQCVDGMLHITDVRSENYSSRLFGPGNYHVYDFSFANTRTRAFLNP